MKKIIQLRGTNATGKTTACRQFVQSGHFCVRSVPVHGKDIEYHYDDERKIAVVGRYDQRECGGVDGYIKNKNFLRDSIVKIIKKERPDALIFEGVMYGVTFKFGAEIDIVSKKLGYHYVGICFFPPLDVALERLYSRNGGKEVNVKSFQDKHISAAKAYKKLRDNGTDVKIIDTSKIPLKDMKRIIEDEL